MTARRLTVAFAALVLLTAGCTFYPQTVERYDAGCKIVSRQMILRSTDVMRGSGGGECSGVTDQSGAVACIAVMLGWTAASAIVSGSIVVAGNTVYWLEKQGKCIAKPTGAS